MPARKNTVVALMLKHAAWLVGEAKQHVNVQSWKDFAQTGVLRLDEEPDIEMDQLENFHLARPIPNSPTTLALSPTRKRVGPCTATKLCPLITLILPGTKRRFPVFP